MNDSAARCEFANVILSNDHRTPYDFVAQTLHVVFDKSEREAHAAAAFAGWLGSHALGTYPVAVAQSLVDEATRYAGAAGHVLDLKLERILDADGSAERTCSFCGKAESAVRRLMAGKGAAICDACVIGGARMLESEVSGQRFKYAHELLDWHFAGRRPEHIASSVRSFPERVRADLQQAVGPLFAEKAIRSVGINSDHQYDSLTVAALLQHERQAKTIGPLRYVDIDVGEDEGVKCVDSALWLLREEDVPFAVLLVHQKDFRGGGSVNVEIAAPAGEDSVCITERFFRTLELAVTRSASYRGKVLSLEQLDQYSGKGGGVLVHRLAPVARDEIILPEKTIELIERNIVQFARQREALRKLGQSVKKGVLFYGPPGTGKTHTVRYLATALPGHTTLLITSEQVGLLPDYFTLARLLAPSIVVIEDADLIARERTQMDTPCEEVLLNKLLNEMDGLRSDAEIFFILTTNRPEMLEPALASRPGRIDQAVEFPLPDEEGRRKLVALYGRGLQVDKAISEDIVSKTEGVSAAFIKELMRRTAQYNLARNGDGHVTNEDAWAAIEEMLFSGGKLNRTLLGSRERSA